MIHLTSHFDSTGIEKFTSRLNGNPIFTKTLRYCFSKLPVPDDLSLDRRKIKRGEKRNIGNCNLFIHRNISHLFTKIQKNREFEIYVKILRYTKLLKQV